MDWNDRPEEEIMDMILSRVFGKDRLAVSMVSRYWNAVTKNSPYSHSPCLIFPHGKSNNNNFLKVFQHNAYFHIDFPRLLVEKNALTRCTKYGWSLMSCDDGTLFFIDPFNNQKIQVPKPPKNGYTTISFFHPPTSPDCFIVGLFQCDQSQCAPISIDILRHGQDEWKMYYCQNKLNRFESSFAPPMLHGDALYFLDLKGNVAVFSVSDENPGEILEESQMLLPYFWFIFPRCLEPLKLRRNIREHFWVKDKEEDAIFAVFVMNEDRKVRVFKLLDVDRDYHWKPYLDVYLKLRWEPVEDLGDKVFYVSMMSSFSYTTPIKSMANKIFFSKFHDDKVVFYSLDTKKYHTFGAHDYSSDYPYGFKCFDYATWTLPAPPPQGQALSWCPKEDVDMT